MSSTRQQKKTTTPTRTTNAAKTGAKSTKASTASRTRKQPPETKTSSDAPTVQEGETPQVTVLGEAASQALVKVSSSALTEVVEQLNFDYEKVEDLSARASLRDAAITIKNHMRRTYYGVIECGQKLLEAKELVPKNTFMQWFNKEFKGEFSYDTATNYMNIARARLESGYTDDELQRLPLGTLYTIFRSTMPEGAQAAVIEAAKSKRVTEKDADAIVKAYRSYQTTNLNVRPEVREALIDSPISENPDELKRFNRLSHKTQMKVAEVLSEDGQLTLRDALSSIRKDEDPKQSKDDETIDAEIIAPVSLHNKISGNWIDLVNNLEPESIDLCFAEMPLGKETLQDYGILAQAMYRALKPGGMLLAVAGQQNIQFLGPQLDPLTVGWTFFIRRRPGNSARVIGRITYASSVIPLSFSYKSPLRQIPGLIDDLRTEADISPDIMSFGFEDVQREHAENMASGEYGVSIEGSISYYLQRLLAPTDVFLHLIPDESHSFGIQESTLAAATTCQASRIITAVGR
jgi:hypothetical protein